MFEGYNKSAKNNFILALITSGVLIFSFLILSLSDVFDTFFNSLIGRIIVIPFYIAVIFVPWIGILNIIAGFIFFIQCLVRKEKGKIISIISIIIGIVIFSVFVFTISPCCSRSKSRDAKRVFDIKQMQTALELYFNDAKQYPLNIRTGGTIEFEGTVYMKIVPKNPTSTNDGDCPKNLEYQYTQKENGESYELIFCIGAKAGYIEAGFNVATPGGIYTLEK